MARLEEGVENLSDGLKERWKDHAKDFLDHETRLRALETVITGLTAANTKSSGIWQWVWLAGIALVDIALHILSLVAGFVSHGVL